jgi:hypothetical protein
MDVLGSFTDYQIIPDEGSRNPFVSPDARTAGPREFTLWLVPSGQQAHVLEMPNSANILQLPRRDTPRVPPGIEIWYRVYLPDENTLATGCSGPPIVTAFDALTMVRVKCPIPSDDGFLAGRALLHHILPGDNTDQVRFYSSTGEGSFPNPDNRYALARLHFRPGRDLAVVRFKPPRTPSTSEGETHGSAAAYDVRYWSLELFGLSSRTFGGLSDNDVTVDEDGYVTVVVGPDDLEEEVLSRGLNFIPRGGVFEPCLIYRNLLSQNGFDPFRGTLAPRGYYMGRDVFLARSSPRSGPRRHGVSRYRMAPAFPTAMAPRTPQLRLAVSWTFLAAAAWPNLLSKDSSRQVKMFDQLSVISDSFSRYTRDRLGIEGTIVFWPTDMIMDGLVAGQIDYALIPGYEYMWVRRLHPELEPLLYGTNGSAGSVGEHVNIVVRSNFLPYAGTVERNRNMERLRGSRLSVYPQRPHDLFFLHWQIYSVELSDATFFAANPVASDNAEEAIDNIIDGPVKSAPPPCDVVVVDDTTLTSYQRRKPGRAARLLVLQRSPIIPGPALIYCPRNTTQAQRDTVEKWLVSPGGAVPIEQYSAQDVRLLLLGRYFGISSFWRTSAAYRRELGSFCSHISDVPEYVFPFDFFSPASELKELR